MFNRVLPKRQCVAPYTIASRAICAYRMRSHHHGKSFSSSIHSTLNTASCVSLCSHCAYCQHTPTSSSLLSLHFHHRRWFGTKIRTYNQPDVGEGTVEVDILEWLVKPGDTVTALQTIGRGKYEKADVDILAPTYGGKVHQILVEEGAVAIVGKPLLEFEVEDDGATTTTTTTTANTDTGSDDDDSSAQLIDSSTITKQISGIELGSTRDMLALPATKHFAKEHGVDLRHVNGTGKDGRILKEDVIRFMSEPQTTVTTSASFASSPAAKPAPLSVPKRHAPLSEHTRQDRVERIFGVKKAMVKKMGEANHVPMFGYGDEIVLNELVALRKQLKPLGDKYGVKITYLPFILKAASLALMQPQSTCLNAYVNADCTELTHKSVHNIGVAIDSAEGLIVPNIKHVDQKSILEIAQDLDALIARGKNNQITNEDVTGGTFTLSNIGAIGGTYCRPICFVPEVCIGALGAIKQFPRYNEDNELYKASVMAVSWSADHRVIDGATVARFSNDFKQYLEHPSVMLLYLK